MKARFLPALAACILSACQSSTAPTAAEMDKYYHAAEAQADRDIDHLHTSLAAGEITQEEFDYRAQKIRDSIPQRASKMAWARHEIAEAEMRAAGIPTGDHPMTLDPPNRGGMDSFYRAAGTQGPGYQGMGVGMWHGYQPGATVGSLIGAQ